MSDSQRPWEEERERGSESEREQETDVYWERRERERENTGPSLVAHLSSSVSDLKQWLGQITLNTSREINICHCGGSGGKKAKGRNYPSSWCSANSFYWCCPSSYKTLFSNSSLWNLGWLSFPIHYLNTQLSSPIEPASVQPPLPTPGAFISKRAKEYVMQLILSETLKHPRHHKLYLLHS